MTRANFYIIAGYPKMHTFERGSDGYPSGVMEDIFKFVLSVAKVDKEKKELSFWDNSNGQDLANFISDCNLILGHVGNFSYAYEINLKERTVRAWESTTRWINAPKDWKEKGWSCYENKKGVAGYTTWVKGKKLFDVKFSEMIIVEGENAYFNNELLEKLKES